MAPNNSSQCAHFTEAAEPRDKSNEKARAEEPPSDVEATLEFDDNDSFGKAYHLSSPSMEDLKSSEKGHFDQPAKLHARIKSDETENIMNLLTSEVLESPTRSASVFDSFTGKDTYAADRIYTFDCPSDAANLNMIFKMDSFELATTAVAKREDKDNLTSTRRSGQGLSIKVVGDSGIQNSLPSLPVKGACTGTVYTYQHLWGVNKFMQLPLPMPILITDNTEGRSKRKRDSEDFSPAVADETRHIQTNVGLDLLCNVSANFDPSLDIGCRCSRTRCLKLYCDCFQTGKICTSSCSCTSCLNTEGESGEHGERTKAIHTILSRRPDAFQKKDKSSKTGCACRNSKCLKKYCVCFSDKALCGSRCTCTHCMNVTSLDGVTGSRESVEDTASVPPLSQENDEYIAYV